MNHLVVLSRSYVVRFVVEHLQNEIGIYSVLFETKRLKESS